MTVPRLEEEGGRVGAHGVIGEWRPGSSVTGRMREVVFRVVYIYWYMYTYLLCHGDCSALWAKDGVISCGMAQKPSQSMRVQSVLQQDSCWLAAELFTYGKIC